MCKKLFPTKNDKRDRRQSQVTASLANSKINTIPSFLPIGILIKSSIV